MKTLAAPRLRTASFSLKDHLLASNPVPVSPGMQDEPQPDRQGSQTAIQGLGDDVVFAYAALVVSGRMAHLSENDAVEYLYLISDDFGIDNVSLARLIVEGAEGRATSLN